MRQEIVDSVNRMDSIDARIDVAFTFNWLTQEEKDFYKANGRLRFYGKVTKTYIKEQALADENIAEYVLQY